MKFKFAICFRTSEHSMAIWVTEEAWVTDEENKEHQRKMKGEA